VLAAGAAQSAGVITAHGLAVARGRLLARLAGLIEAAPALPDAQRFAKHLATEFPAVFAFLGYRALTRRTGVRSRRFVPPSWPERFVEAIARGEAPIRSKSSPASRAPFVSGVSI
jgi:hypothetical protein